MRTRSVRRKLNLQLDRPREERALPLRQAELAVGRFASDRDLEMFGVVLV